MKFAGRFTTIRAEGALLVAKTTPTMTAKTVKFTAPALKIRTFELETLAVEQEKSQSIGVDSRCYKYWLISARPGVTETITQSFQELESNTKN